jgi:hypothetical protein
VPKGHAKNAYRIAKMNGTADCSTVHLSNERQCGMHTYERPIRATRITERPIRAKVVIRTSVSCGTNTIQQKITTEHQDNHEVKAKLSIIHFKQKIVQI